MDYAARYAELAVKVGANVQPGQRLVLLGEPEHAPLLRALAEAGWRAGAADVECLYLDEHIRRLHAIHAPDDLLDRTPAWVEIAALGAEGAASVQTLGDADPHLLADVDQSRAARAMPRRLREIAIDHMARLATAWTVIACPTAGWARSLFGEPDVERLWREIAAVTRLDTDDPVAAWRSHVARLQRRTRQLDEWRFTGLRFRGPGHGSIRRAPRERAMAVGGVPHVVGPGDRRQPADRRGLHDTRPRADRGNRAPDLAALLARLVGRGRLAALRRRQGSRGRSNGRRGVPPHRCSRPTTAPRDSARSRSSTSTPPSGDAASCSRTPSSTRTIVPHRDRVRLHRPRRGSGDRSTRKPAARPGSTSRRSTSTSWSAAPRSTSTGSEPDGTSLPILSQGRWVLGDAV